MVAFLRAKRGENLATGFDGSIRINTKIDSSGFNSGIKTITAGTNKLKVSMQELGVAVASAFFPLTIAAATIELIKFGAEGVKATSELSNALLGLKSIVEGQGRSFADAREFIEDYVSDGLVPLTNAVTAYKNLAARGYDDTQIQQVLVALKDSAAFGRQASYSLGEAVSTATEGLKNENSVLVDNAGVTKNVAKMWDEYAKSIGTTSNNLTQQQKIQAEVSGILEETRFQTGDAAKVADTFSGKVSKMTYEFERFKVALGDVVIPLVESVIPLITLLLQGLTLVLEKLGELITFFTGKPLNSKNVTESLGEISTSAGDAADDVESAKEEIKKALANFDDLNILRLGETETASINLDQVESALSGLGDAQELVDAINGKIDEFGNHFIAVAKESTDGFKTMMQEVRAEALNPITVTAPVFAPIPDPVYRPNWGLDLPVNIPTPVFPTLPDPVYQPEWGLVESLQPVLSTATALASSFVSSFVSIFAQLVPGIVPQMALLGQSLVTSAQAAMQGILTTAPALVSWGNAVLQVGYQAATGFAQSVGAMAEGALEMIGTFASSSANALVSWGNGVINIASQVASGFVQTISSMLSSAWEGIKSLASAAGVALDSFNSFMEKPVVKAVLTAGIVVGSVALAPASGGASLAGLAAIPAVVGLSIPGLADGAVIPPNKQFLAVLGDQTNGTNIETPLATMLDAFNAALDARDGIGSGDITLRITGGDQLTRYLKFEVDKQNTLSGVRLVQGGK